MTATLTNNANPLTRFFSLWTATTTILVGVLPLAKTPGRKKLFFAKACVAVCAAWITYFRDSKERVTELDPYFCVNRIASSKLNRSAMIIHYYIWYNLSLFRVCVCVCVCVRARARARASVCVCARVRVCFPTIMVIWAKSWIMPNLPVLSQALQHPNGMRTLHLMHLYPHVFCKTLYPHVFASTALKQWH